MAFDVVTYAKSKNYTDETVLGGGAIKGKNLVVTSIEAITDGVRINVQWTLDDGTVLTDYVDLFDGKDGKGIKSVAINSEEHLIITYDDDTTTDAGKIEIQSAVDSVNGETGDVVLEITDIVNVGSNLTYNAQTKTLSADAQAQVQADWEQSDNTQADYIKNKPTLGTASEKDAINAVLAGSPSLPTGGAVKTAIDEAVSGAYHHAGTKTVAELTSALLVEANDGNVYNMTDSGVTTADFIEGAGKPIAIGDNVGVAKVGNDYKFDLLSGFVDTSNFVNKSSTSGLIKNDGTIDTTDYADKSEMSITDGTGADLGTSTIQLKSGTSKKVLTEHQDVTGKADKVQNATNNNLATLDGFGNLKDSGKAITDIIPNGGTTGQVLAKHSNTDGDVEWKDVQSGEVKAKATYDITPATKPHAVDSFIYFNNVVYKVTSAISIGDTIAVGTNITADTGLDVDTQMYVDGSTYNEVGLLKANGEIDKYGNTGGGGDTSALANKTDLTAIILTGTTNTSGDVISAGTWFYLNGKPCIAKVDIASGATFTLNTNYEEKTIGSALTELNSNISSINSDLYNDTQVDFSTGIYFPLQTKYNSLSNGESYFGYLEYGSGVSGSMLSMMMKSDSNYGVIVAIPVFRVANGYDNVMWRQNNGVWYKRTLF
jgi:hypothetical protein